MRKSKIDKLKTKQGLLISLSVNLTSQLKGCLLDTLILFQNVKEAILELSHSEGMFFTPRGGVNVWQGLGVSCMLTLFQSVKKG